MKKILLQFILLAIFLGGIPAAAMLAGKTDTQNFSENGGFLHKLTDISMPEALPGFYRLEDSSGRILEISPAEYLVGVAAAELPASYSRECVTAQMVAAHSYALSVMADDLKKGGTGTVSSDPARHQGYLNPEQRRFLYGERFEERENLLEDAAREAVNWILSPDGKDLLPAAYHSCSPGFTEDAANIWGRAVPCLTPAESSADLNCPDFQRETVFSRSEAEKMIREKFPGAVFSGGCPVEIKEISPSGTVLKASAGGIPCTGCELRTCFSLPSASFTASVRDDSIVFVTRGSGHGVGMSQYGAEQMSLSGSSWQEILAHYYPGSVLMNTSEIVLPEKYD